MLVILVLGALLTGFGGSVRLPRFDTLPDGSRQRVFTTDTDGNKTPVFDNKNKFLNSQNLAQLAKDTSFTAIMAVGMTFVIIAGQIDLSVGATYALASVLGALVLQQFGPDGKHAASPLFGATRKRRITLSAAPYAGRPTCITFARRSIWMAPSMLRSARAPFGNAPSSETSIVTVPPRATGSMLIT